ncbi:MAG: hypothetical protein ACK5Z5_07765 [Neisseriaceae bacterium]|jgi:hypothetical protein
MNKATINKLETKTKEELLEIIIQLAKFKGVTEFIKLHYLSEPNEATKELKKLFDKYKRKTTRFYEYYVAIEFFNELVYN